MKKKILLTLNILILFLFFPPMQCLAQGIASKLILEPSSENIKRQESFYVKIKSHFMENIELSLLNIKIKFDNKKFDFKTAKVAPDEEKNFKFSSLGGEIDILFTNLKSPTQTTGSKDKDICILNFEVKDGAKYGTSKITSKVVSSYDYSNTPVNIKNAPISSINIIPLAANAYELSSLKPCFGSLTPSFTPSIYDYTLDVPNEVKDVYFDFSTISPNAEVTINRHRLNAAGQTTYIKINVCNKKEKLKITYNIKVNRAEKPPKSENDEKSTRNEKKYFEKQSRNNSELLISKENIYQSCNEKIGAKNGKFYNALKSSHKEVPEGDNSEPYKCGKENNNKYSEDCKNVNSYENSEGEENINIYDDNKEYNVDFYKNSESEKEEKIETPNCREITNKEENTSNCTKNFDKNKNDYTNTLVSSIVLTIFIFAYSLINILKTTIKGTIKRTIKC